MSEHTPTLQIRVEGHDPLKGERTIDIRVGDEWHLLCQLGIVNFGGPGSEEKSDQYRALADRAHRLFLAAPALVAVLRAVEWVEDIEGWELCPSCRRTKGKGHTPDCQLDKALRAAEPD
jgi:hypothetical protein